MHRRIIIVAAGALGLAACGSSGGSPANTTTAARPQTHLASPSSAPPASPTASVTSETTSPVEGHWLSRVLTPADVRPTVPKRYLSTFVDGWKTIQFGLKIEDGYWTEYYIKDGGAPTPSDYGGTYSISGNKIPRPGPPGGPPQNVFEWRVEGNHLTLTMLEDGEADSNGVPDRVYTHVIYEAHPFTKQS